MGWMFVFLPKFIVEVLASTVMVFRIRAFDVNRFILGHKGGNCMMELAPL